MYLLPFRLSTATNPFFNKRHEESLSDGGDDVISTAVDDFLNKYGELENGALMPEFSGGVLLPRSHRAKRSSVDCGTMCGCHLPKETSWSLSSCARKGQILAFCGPLDRLKQRR